MTAKGWGLAWLKWIRWPVMRSRAMPIYIFSRIDAPPARLIYWPQTMTYPEGVLAAMAKLGTNSKMRMQARHTQGGPARVQGGSLPIFR